MKKCYHCKLLFYFHLLAEFGSCAPHAPYCFSRLPPALQEQTSEMLRIDSSGTTYRYKVYYYYLKMILA